MTRQIIVHLRVEAPDADEREPNEIAWALQGALQVGSDSEEVQELTVTTLSAEELEVQQ